MLTALIGLGLGALAASRDERGRGPPVPDTPPATPLRSEPGPVEVRVLRVAARRLPPTPLAPPLAPAEAAHRFVRWMIEHGFAGERQFSGPDGIYEYYLWHSHELHRHAVPDNMFGMALQKLLPSRLINDRSSGRRRRITYYTIADLPLAQVAELTAAETRVKAIAGGGRRRRNVPVSSKAQPSQTSRQKKAA